MATKNQEKVLDIVVKDVRKGKKVSVSRAMRDSGVYSEEFSKHPERLTNSKGWKELVNERLSDSFVTARLRKLFDQKRVEYMSFGLKKSDEEITLAMESAGLTVINIQPTTDSKLAFYSTDDVMAVTKALDMTNKIKGVYLADKVVDSPPTINYNLFYKPEFQDTMRAAEAQMKQLIINAKSTEPTEETLGSK